MSGAVAGACLGAFFGVGLLQLVTVALTRRQALLHTRVLLHLRDLPQTRALPQFRAAQLPADLPASLLGALARGIERVLGGSASVERRLARSGTSMSLDDFRVAQALWGVVAFAIAAVPAALLAVGSPDRALPLLLACGVAAALAVLLRENRLTTVVTRHERQMLQEFPAVAGLLALAVAAGESPAAALTRVVERSSGALADELRAVLAAVRTGAPLAAAFDALAARTGLPVVARFAEGVAIAVERGTPLAEVLHAQAHDVREAGRRALIETGARKEVLMMVPVVFLVLPVVVVFAFFPGLIGLRLVV